MKRGKKLAKLNRDRLKNEIQQQKEMVKKQKRRLIYLEAQIKTLKKAKENRLLSFQVKSKQVNNLGQGSTQAVQEIDLEQKVQSFLETCSYEQLNRRLLTLEVLEQESKMANYSKDFKGDLIAKYKLKRKMRPILGVYKAGKIGKSPRSSKSNLDLAKKVLNFYLKDENSALTPNNKGGFKTFKGLKEKKRIMMKKISQIFLEFKEKNPSEKIGLTTFWKMKPFYVVPAKYSDRDTCACQRCENFELRFQAAKRAGLIR